MIVTQDVQEFILYHRGHEIHLIDTPGFDDCNLVDHDVLLKISDWVNTVYSQGWRIGGIIYMYDITRSRLGGIGEQNIRLLEELTGKDRWSHISLVTNKWHWSGSHESELQRERELKSDERAWKALLEGGRPARLHRFSNDQNSALEIIQWHLDQGFHPEISCQMANPAGPQLSLGDTDAGKIILRSYAPKFSQLNHPVERARLDQVLSHKFDNQLAHFAIQGMLAKLLKAKREHRLQQVGRWFIRLGMVGGTILVTLATENPGVVGTGISIGSGVEARLQRQRTLKKEEIAAIESAIHGAMMN